MDITTDLRRFFEIQRQYSLMYEAYIARGFSRTLDPHDKENRIEDDEQLQHYFKVGADALRATTAALIANSRDVPSAILDFPCGSGRVTRHLRAYFPDSRLVACDLYASHVNFCVEQFGAEGFMSKENFDAIDFEGAFDLIFCGSLLTHLPADLCGSALRLISRSLSPRGIAIVTLHGRHSEYIQRHKWQYVEETLYAKIDETLEKTGFGYVDYDSNIRSTFNRQARYGITVIRPRWAMSAVESDDRTRVLGYVERGWADHQDVLVIGRPGINE